MPWAPVVAISPRSFGRVLGAVRHRWPAGCPDWLSTGLGPRDVCSRIRVLSELGASGQITPSFSITTVLLAFAFAVSVGIGVIFGFYPARRAAKLDPSSVYAISKPPPTSCGEIGTVYAVNRLYLALFHLPLRECLVYRFTPNQIDSLNRQ